MVGVSNVTVSFGGTVLFENITFLINRDDRIGLTGRNGAGKSTLLKIISGYQAPTSGDVTRPRDCTIGYLPQEFHNTSVLSVKEEARTTFEEVVRLEKELAILNEQVATREDYESDSYFKLLEDLHDKQQRFQLLGGYEMEEQIEKILKGLGFSQEDIEQPVSSFSGGWQMRIELAKILLRKPDLVLLDEPTNHLDIESILWLEEFLCNYPGAIMMISHDKAFLDKITTRTIEITRGKTEDYKANYSKYLQLRQERRDQISSAQKNQQKQIDQMERNIERFRYKASKASFAQNLIKKLDKIERIELDDEEIAAMRLRFPDPPRAGVRVVTGEDASKSFGNKKVIKPFSFTIERGDKVAFVGKNGMGKTTLSRMIVGDLDFEGKLELGHNVHLGYFAQHRSNMLSGDNSILKEMEDAAHGSDRFTQVRGILGAFLFSGETVEKKIKVLSGGEKSRLSMAKLLLEPLNLLVLDEPTNHLDMISKEVLKQALQNFEGTIIIVSHDRDFLDGLTNKIFEFTPEGIKEHLGGVTEFLALKNAGNFRDFEIPGKEKEQDKAKVTGKDDYEKKKQQDRDLKKRKNAVQQSEQKIESLSEKIKAIDQQLLDPAEFERLSKDQPFFAKYEQLKKEYDAEMQKWEQAIEALDKAES